MSSRSHLKYYFTGSTKEIDKDRKRYRFILNQLERIGCKGLNYVHYPEENSKRKRYEEELRSGKTNVYDLQTSLIEKSDILIADITKESITVGYQIDYALKRKIPVLVLISKYNKKRISVMLTDDHYGLLTVKKYSSIEDVKRIVAKFVKSVVSGKIKFNFFISILLHNYITKRAETESKSKSEVIRDIITKEIKNNPQ